jgi:hypothetical protein
MTYCFLVSVFDLRYVTLSVPAVFKLLKSTVPGHFTTLWKLRSTSTPSGQLAREAAEYMYSAGTESVNLNQFNKMPLSSKCNLTAQKGKHWPTQLHMHGHEKLKRSPAICLRWDLKAGL